MTAAVVSDVGRRLIKRVKTDAAGIGDDKGAGDKAAAAGDDPAVDVIGCYPCNAARPPGMRRRHRPQSALSGAWCRWCQWRCSGR